MSLRDAMQIVIRHQRSAVQRIQPLLQTCIFYVNPYTIEEEIWTRYVPWFVAKNCVHASYLLTCASAFVAAGSSCSCSRLAGSRDSRRGARNTAPLSQQSSKKSFYVTARLRFCEGDADCDLSCPRLGMFRAPGPRVGPTSSWPTSERRRPRPMT